MSVTRAEDLSGAFVEAFNAGDMQALLTLYEPNVKYFTRSGQLLEGHVGVSATFERLLAARGEMQIDNEYCVVNGDAALVRARWRYRATGADGRPIEGQGVSAEVLRRGADGT